MSEENSGGIKSPFMKNTKVVRNHLNSEQIIVEAVYGFKMTLEALRSEGVNPRPEVLTGYIAGFTTTLNAIGFDKTDAMKLGIKLTDAIFEAGGGVGCGDCDACKAKKQRHERE